MMTANKWPIIHVEKRPGSYPIARGIKSVMIDGKDYGHSIRGIKWETDMSDGNEGVMLTTITFMAYFTIAETDDDNDDPYEYETRNS